MSTNRIGMTAEIRKAMVDRAIRIITEVGSWQIDEDRSRVIGTRVYLIDPENELVGACDIEVGSHGRPKLVAIDVAGMIHPDDLDDDDDVDGIAS